MSHCVVISLFRPSPKGRDRLPCSLTHPSPAMTRDRPWSRASHLRRDMVIFFAQELLAARITQTLDPFSPWLPHPFRGHDADMLHTAKPCRRHLPLVLPEHGSHRMHRRLALLPSCPPMSAAAPTLTLSPLHVYEAIKMAHIPSRARSISCQR